MLVVRANQLAAGGSGVDPAVLDVLADVINSGLAVTVPAYGAIGTGDLTALAATALCLRGERDWLPAGPLGTRQPRFSLTGPNTLAFLSSNAATIGEACLACHDLTSLLDVSTLITAFSLMAANGSAEPYAEPVNRRRGRPGDLRGDRPADRRGWSPWPQRRAAAGSLDSVIGANPGPVRVPGVAAEAMRPVDAARHAVHTATVDMNSAAETPWWTRPGQTSGTTGTSMPATSGSLWTG